MANGWTPAPTPPTWQAAPQQSGLRKASAILLLVGAILAAISSVLMLVFTLLFSVVFARLTEETGAEGFGVFLWFYGIFGVLAAAGSVCGFVAWRKAARDDLHGAFVWGLVGSLLPPLNIVSLLGAIFAKVCPEGEAQAQARGAARPPAPQVR
jgi:hypothetical protein